QDWRAQPSRLYVCRTAHPDCERASADAQWNRGGRGRVRPDLSVVGTDAEWCRLFQHILCISSRFNADMHPWAHFPRHLSQRGTFQPNAVTLPLYCDNTTSDSRPTFRMRSSTDR